MDERAVKRLLVMLAVSIIAIMLLKTMMLKTAVKVSHAAIEKRQAAIAKQAAEQQSPALSPDGAMAINLQQASAVVPPVDAPASSPAASSVSGTQY